MTLDILLIGLNFFMGWSVSLIFDIQYPPSSSENWDVSQGNSQNLHTRSTSPWLCLYTTEPGRRTQILIDWLIANRIKEIDFLICLLLNPNGRFLQFRLSVSPFAAGGMSFLFCLSAYWRPHMATIQHISKFRSMESREPYPLLE
jgi:hypothetical protein